MCSHLLTNFLLLLHAGQLANCQNYQFVTGPPDKSPDTWRLWWEEYTLWRSEIASSLNLSNYDLEQVRWAKTSFMQPQVMIHERYLYDRDKNQWTVGRYLADVRYRYGGVDSVLLWASYPNIGVDDRNQFEMTESLPGGLASLAEVIAEFHREGVRVLLPYNPWDQHTRPPPLADPQQLIDQIVATDSDGFNGDTMDGVGAAFWKAGLARGHAVVMEPEGLRSSWSALEYNLMSWAYWTPGARARHITHKQDIPLPVESGKLMLRGPVKPRGGLPVLGPPLIAAYKAVTFGKHLTHLCERWADNHIDGIQQAFFNGIGFETWENVWGLWNGLTERDAEAVRRVGALLRQFSHLVQHPGLYWPHVPIVQGLESIIYASMFTGDNSNGQPERLWFLINRDLEQAQSDRLELPCDELWLVSPDEVQLFDVYHGRRIMAACEDGIMILNMSIEAGGLGALYASSSQSVEADLAEFLAIMQAMTALPLAAFPSAWLPLQQELEDHTTYNTMLAASSMHSPTTPAVFVPGGQFRFHCFGTAIEGNRLPLGTDVQFSWEAHPQQEHDHLLGVADLLVDRYPVTNAAYHAFLLASGWLPMDRQNWLRHWIPAEDEIGLAVPTGFDQKPVVWVSHADARAYCNYYGRRLPHSWEWQWVAQGSDARGWPWGGNGTVPDLARMPLFSTERIQPPPDDVDSHPDGASWCGVEDLVGNVYQWTGDIFTDSHTSRAVLRGSPRWRPTGPNAKQSWYFPLPFGQHWYPVGSSWESWSSPGPLYEHSTLLLHSESLDRSAGIGFRCVQDI